MRRKITKSTIDSAKPSETTYIIFDTELVGYGLKVTPTGKKVFIYQYRLRGSSKSQRITIGRYLDFVENYCERQKLTAYTAREIAEILRGKVKSGKNPKPELSTDDDKLILTTTLLDQFVRDYVEVKLKPSTQYGYKGYIKNCEFNWSPQHIL